MMQLNTGMKVSLFFEVSELVSQSFFVIYFFDYIKSILKNVKGTPEHTIAWRTMQIIQKSTCERN